MTVDAMDIYDRMRLRRLVATLGPASQLFEPTAIVAAVVKVLREQQAALSGSEGWRARVIRETIERDTAGAVRYAEQAIEEDRRLRELALLDAPTVRRRRNRPGALRLPKFFSVPMVRRKIVRSSA